ncbi:unnamed protein product [Arctogadus glacialis]
MEALSHFSHSIRANLHQIRCLGDYCRLLRQCRRVTSWSIYSRNLYQLPHCRIISSAAAVHQRKGLYSRSLAAGLPPSFPCRSCSSAGPQNLSYALMPPSYIGGGAETDSLVLVTVGGVLSEMHISLKKSCTDFFQSLYACGSTRDPKQHPKSQEKCCFHNLSPLTTSFEKFYLRCHLKALQYPQS